MAACPTITRQPNLNEARPLDGLLSALVSRELKELDPCGTIKAELESPETLPTDLEEMYAMIIRRSIARSIPSDGKFVQQGIKMLTWAIFAKRRLTAKEFEVAVAVPSPPYPFDSGPIKPHSCAAPQDSWGQDCQVAARLSVYCGDLIRIKGEVVQLRHKSIREFLLQKDAATAPFNMDEVRGDTEISSICFRYLRILSRRPGPAEVADWSDADFDEFVKWVANYPLLDYVVAFLPHHMKSLPPGSPAYEEQSLFFKALTEDTTIFCLFGSWVWLLGLDMQTTHHRHAMRPDIFRIKAFQAATRGRFVQVIKLILTLQPHPEWHRHETGVSALCVAVAAGNDEVANLLLEWGAGADFKGPEACDAVQEAAAKGDSDLISLLAAVHNVNVYLKGGKYGGVVQAAAANGHEEMIDFLQLDRADFNSQGGKYGTALQAASAKGHAAVVFRLLEYGEHIHAEGGKYGSALTAASAKGHKTIVETLLNGGSLPIQDMAAHCVQRQKMAIRISWIFCYRLRHIHGIERRAAVGLEFPYSVHNKRISAMKYKLLITAVTLKS